MRCLVLALKNDENNTDVMNSVTFLVTNLQDIFKKEDIKTFDILKDKESIEKTLIFSSNTLMIDFIITVGGFDFESECIIAMEAMEGVINQPNNTVLQFLDALLPDAYHRFNYGILDGTLIFNFPGRLDYVTEYYTACKAVLPHLITLVKKSSKITQELAPNEEETINHHQNRLRSKVDVSQIENSTFDGNLGLEAALKVIFGTTHDLHRQIENCSIENILGSVLANNVIASNDVPSGRISKINGFAFEAIDYTTNVKWPLIELKPGYEKCPLSTFVSVSIGDTIPSGATHVVKMEDCTIEGDHITTDRTYSNYNYGHITNAGIGVRKNEIIISKGTLIGPFEKGLLAHLKISVFPIYSKPRVSFLSIEGFQDDEVESLDSVESLLDSVDGGDESLLDSVTIREMQLSLLGESNIILHNMGVVKLHPDQIKTRLVKAFRKSDVIIVATQKLRSPDKYILEHVLLEDFQASIHFTRLQMNPNTQTLFATCILDGKPKFIFGLPGNPVYSFVTYKLIILPSLMSFMGAKHERLNTDFVSPNNTLHTLISNQFQFATKSTKDNKWVKDVISSCKVFPDSSI